MSEWIKSVTHRTCALNGKHTSEQWAAECLVLGRTVKERLQRFREAKTGFQAPKPPSEGRDSGPPEMASPAPEKSIGSNTISRRIGTGRAFRPGRPRLGREERLQKRRERDRRARKSLVPA